MTRVSGRPPSVSTDQQPALAVPAARVGFLTMTCRLRGGCSASRRRCPVLRACQAQRRWRALVDHVVRHGHGLQAEADGLDGAPGLHRRSPTTRARGFAAGGSGNQSATGTTKCLWATVAGACSRREERRFQGLFHSPATRLEPRTFCVCASTTLPGPETRWARGAGTSKRLKGLEPSTFCMASRRRVTRRAGLPPANCAKRPVQPRQRMSRISPRFAGVLSTNCPPRTRADQHRERLSALRFAWI